MYSMCIGKLCTYVDRHCTLIFATLLNVYVQCGVSVTLVCSAQYKISKIDVLCSLAAHCIEVYVGRD